MESRVIAVNLFSDCVSCILVIQTCFSDWIEHCAIYFVNKSQISCHRRVYHKGVTSIFNAHGMKVLAQGRLEVHNSLWLESLKSEPGSLIVVMFAFNK